VWVQAITTERDTMLHTEPSSVLVVDDEKLIRWSLRERLEQAGYRVSVAGSGRETLERLDEQVAVVLLDLRLPDTDGLELCDRIRQLAPQCRVILMTAEWTPELVQLARGHGAFEVLQKPFNLDDMTLAVDRAGVKPHGSVRVFPHLARQGNDGSRKPSGLAHALLDIRSGPHSATAVSAVGRGGRT
jgi:DNA-binding NtrC family response regulator